MGQPTGKGKTAITKSPNAIATVLLLYNFDIDGSDLKDEDRKSTRLNSSH